MWETIAKEETPSRLSGDDDLISLETRMAISFPEDHREFLKTFGEGVLFNHIRVFGADTIDAEVAQYQERWKEYFLWDDSESALDENEIAECVIVGDTFNGDEFALSPAHPGKLFYLPQDSSIIVDLGSSLEQALNRTVENLKAEILNYPEEEQEEWDLRPVFNVSSF